MIQERIAGFLSYSIVRWRIDGRSEVLGELLTHDEAWQYAFESWEDSFAYVCVTIVCEQNGIVTVPLFCHPEFDFQGMVDYHKEMGSYEKVARRPISRCC